MATKDLTFRLLGEDSTATLALRRLSDEAGKTGKHFEGAFKLAGAAVAGIGLAAVAGTAAIVKTGIGEAMDASKGMAQLQAGIKSTGGAANVSVGHMEDLASSIQGMSGQTDDSIVATEQLLLTFTNIKNQGPNKIFDATTQAAADMAAKMGGDASKYAIQLGKALNDPAAGLSKLTKVGVTFTDAQKKQVTAMQKAGDTAGAQKIILGELNREFGGAAKAAGQSLPGQLARVQRAFEDVSQTVVETILPVVTPAIGAILTAVKRAQPVLQNMARVVATTLRNAFTVIGPILAGFGTVLVSQILPAVAGFGGWMAKNKDLILFLAQAIALAVAGFKTYVVVMQIIKLATVAWAAVQAILNGTMALNPVGLIVIAVIALIAVIVLLVTHWKQVCAFLQGVWAAVCKWFGDTLKSVGQWWSETWSGISRLAKQVFKAMAKVISDWWNNNVKPVIDFFVNAWKALVRGLQIEGRLIAVVVRAMGKVISDWWTNTVKPVIDFFVNAWKHVITFLGGIPGKVRAVFAGAGKWLSNAGKSVIQGLISGIQSMFGNVWAVISRLAGGVIDTFKRLLGIHSPSRVFEGHGKNIAQGLINGLVGHTAGVHAAVAGLVPGLDGGGIGVNVASAMTVGGGGGTVAANRAAGGVIVNVTVQGAMVGTTAQLGQVIVNAIQTGAKQGAIPKNVFTTL